jgi:hypothetical protein
VGCAWAGWRPWRRGRRRLRQHAEHVRQGFFERFVALTTEDVQPTSDGGHIALAETDTSNGVGVTWLLKLDSAGNPQWQEEVGCFKTAPGDNAIGLSLQQTSDGGYIAAGTADFNSNGNLAGVVLKLDGSGNVQWRRKFSPLDRRPTSC